MKPVLVTIILIANSCAILAKSKDAEFIRPYKYDASLKNGDTLSARLYIKKHSFTLSWFVAATGRKMSLTNGAWHFSSSIKDFQKFKLDTAVYSGLRSHRFRLAILNCEGHTLYGLFDHIQAQPCFFLQKETTFFTGLTSTNSIAFGPYYPNVPDMHYLSQQPIFIPSKKQM